MIKFFLFVLFFLFCLAMINANFLIEITYPAMTNANFLIEKEKIIHAGGISIIIMLLVLLAINHFSRIRKKHITREEEINFAATMRLINSLALITSVVSIGGGVVFALSEKNNGIISNFYYGLTSAFLPLLCLEVILGSFFVIIFVFILAPIKNILFSVENSRPIKTLIITLSLIREGTFVLFIFLPQKIIINFSSFVENIRSKKTKT